MSGDAAKTEYAIVASVGNASMGCGRGSTADPERLMHDLTDRRTSGAVDDQLPAASGRTAIFGRVIARSQPILQVYDLEAIALGSPRCDPLKLSLNLVVEVASKLLDHRRVSVRSG